MSTNTKQPNAKPKHPPSINEIAIHHPRQQQAATIIAEALLDHFLKERQRTSPTIDDGNNGITV